MTNSISEFISNAKQNSESISFQEVIALIDSNYNFTPTAFKNGNQFNNAGENNGSCKIFAFAKINNLGKEETLKFFGSYYFDDVLKNPELNNHLNIRNFMVYGWDGISFDGEALELN